MEHEAFSLWKQACCMPPRCRTLLHLTLGHSLGREGPVLNTCLAADGSCSHVLLGARRQVEQGGRERTPAQWKALLGGAGFKLTRIVACRSPVCVVEAVPV